MRLNYIANASLPSLSGRAIPVIDPSDGQPFEEIQRSNAADIDAAVHAARQCLESVRSKLSAAELALLEQRDCGKPIKQAAGARTARMTIWSPSPECARLPAAA